MSCLRVQALPLAFLALGLVAAPQLAEACGGTFCDNLPQAMPVDQTGEDILFVSDGSNIEVHVRIQYEGEAERFAWIVPVQNIPEIAVGSDLLFTALSNATAPAWTTSTSYACEEDEPDVGPKLDLGDDDLTTGGDGGGPNIVLEQSVGAFEVVVLQGGTAQEVTDFLVANDYAQDPDAEPILQEYLDQDFLFAAVKLSAGADVSEIHPLSFTFPGTEPCVPIRLTRIAAEDDMGIRTYFLAEDRWAPSNYAHVVLNPLAYAWETPGPERYLELLGLAVDEAGGQGFVTDFAGDSAEVSQGDIYRNTWDETAFLGADPITAIELIATQGLNQHPLIRSLLLQYIPPPPELDAQDYWNNLGDYADQIDLEAWDDAAFAADLDERIIAPGLHAVDLLDAWPTLTRLHTLMSPGEMTLDPTFHANADLPAVVPHRVVTNEEIQCGAVDRLFHVDIEGQDYPVCVAGETEYPSAWGMPAALRIEQVPMMGPPQVETDNSEMIDTIFAAHNDAASCSDDGFGDTGTEDPTTSGSGSGGEESTETGSGYDLPYDITCGCSTQRGEGPVGVALGLLVLALIAPRRRRD